VKYVVLGMTFHGVPIIPRHVPIATTSIKRASTKLPFPSSTTSKVKNMANGVVLWQEKYVFISK
jgi:hypothetical protein